MDGKQAEASLDEVLSSIKKMVVDAEPPVLDLTDMVADDGSIVKVGEDYPESMGAFLKLAQENADSEKHLDRERKTVVMPERRSTEKNDIMFEIFRDIASPEIKKWLEDNLSEVVSIAVEHAVKQWLTENLSQLAGNIVEREIRDLLKRN